MSLSVIVASYNSHQVLERCLESLAAQAEPAEIVVADCSPRNPAETLGPRFPRVRFLHFREKLTIPQLRWAAYKHTTGDVVAATEGRCIPSPDWCAELLRAHRAAKDAPGVGGPISVRLPASPMAIGLYFCEYGLHAPPPQRFHVRELSGANVSYKRAAVEECRDLVEAAAWETHFHLRWRAQGRPLAMSGAIVDFENCMDLRTAVRQRFHYGRGYAAARVASRGRLAKPLYAAFCLLLPALLTLRLGRIALRRGCLRLFLRAAHWVFFFSAVWSLGEMAGYLRGPSPERHIY